MNKKSGKISNPKNLTEIFEFGFMLFYDFQT